MQIVSWGQFAWNVKSLLCAKKYKKKTKNKQTYFKMSSAEIITQHTKS